MQHSHSDHSSQTPMQFPNQPQMQQSMQSIQPSMQTIQQPMQSIQQPMQSIQQPMQTIQQPMQTIQQPMQSIQQPMQSMQQPMQSMQQPMQSMQQPMQSIQQGMMLCPVQFVYDSQMQAKSDEQMQQVQQVQQVQQMQHIQQMQPNSAFPSNTYIINVQNPPPWIQGRNMNQIVYMPQLMPNNMQPYAQQHMVQNPMYIQQFPQPAPEQMRVQIPQLIQQNMVQPPQNTPQNTQNMAYNMMRIPQMETKQERMPLLTQILQEQTSQGIRKPSPAMPNDMGQAQMTRPTYQNIRPQMLTVNPMPPNHTCAHHNSQTQASNATAEQNQIVTEIPQHIRSQLPEGLSVKTIYKPVPTNMVRPNEYLQNIAPASVPNPVPVMPPVPKLVKHSTTNTDDRITSYKQSTLNKRRPPVMKTEYYTMKKQCTKVEEDTAKLLCKMKHDAIANKANKEMQTNNNAVAENATTERTEEKPIRNTVFVQARGRINEPVANVNTNVKKNDIVQPEATPQNPPESMEVAVDKESPKMDSNPPAQVAPTDPPKEDADNATTPVEEKVPKVKKRTVKKITKERVRQFVLTHVLDGHIIQESNVPFTIKKPSKSPKKLTSHNNTGETEVSFNSLREKKTEVKETAPDTSAPDTSAPVKPAPDKPAPHTPAPDTSVPDTSAPDTSAPDTSAPDTSAPDTSAPDSQEEAPKKVNEDNPFENVRRAELKSWMVSDLFAHLHHHNWRETAQKLREEEIDGESLMLVSKEQLVSVGIEDCHADIICSFLGIT